MSSRAIDPSFYEIDPRRLAADVARAYSLIVLALAAAILKPSVWTVVPAILVVGTQQYALQIILHDGLHSRLMGTKEASDLVARLFLCYPIFNPLAGFRRKHMDHHRRLGTPEDPDRYYHATEDKATRRDFVLFVLGVRSAWVTLAAGLRRAGGGAARRRNAAQAERDAREKRLDLAGLVAVQAAIAAALTGLAGLWAYPVLWVLPWYLGVFTAQNLRSFAEHAQPEPDALADLRRDVTFRAPWIERVVFAPNNMMYHAEHHLYPQVPYYHLPRLRAELERRGEMAHVEYRDSYLGFALRFWKSLPIDVRAPAPSAFPS